MKLLVKLLSGLLKYFYGLNDCEAFWFFVLVYTGLIGLLSLTIVYFPLRFKKNTLLLQFVAISVFVYFRVSWSWYKSNYLTRAIYFMVILFYLAYFVYFVVYMEKYYLLGNQNGFI